MYRHIYRFLIILALVNLTKLNRLQLLYLYYLTTAVSFIEMCWTKTASMLSIHQVFTIRPHSAGTKQDTILRIADSVQHRRIGSYHFYFK